MNLQKIRNILWNNLTLIIVAALVFFGVSESNARKYAPDVESVLESIQEESAPLSGNRAEVVNVYDGDTVTISGGEKLRLIGINAPEIGEEFATSSRDYLSKLILGKEVTLEHDKSERDKYDRLLVYVYLEDVFINEEMVRAGYAHAKAYYPDTAKQDVLEKAEQVAKTTAVGIWSK